MVTDEMADVAARDVCFTFYRTQWEATSPFRQGFARDMVRAALEAVAPMIEAKTAALLSDPTAVHANMLRGTIAKPTWDQIKHLYPDDVRAERKAALEEAAKVAEGTAEPKGERGVLWQHHSLYDNMRAHVATAIRKLGEER
jgi:hypothetical protein